jgi:hypothetical protein
MAMNVSALLNAVLVLALVVFVLYRQAIARPVVARRLWLLPAILAVIGIAAITHVDNGNLSTTAVEYLAVDLVASIALGGVRGCFVRLFERDGVLWRQGGFVIIALWVATIGIRIGIAVLAGAAGVANVMDAALELSLGISLLAQNGVVALRGSRMGLRFAPGRPTRRRRARIRSSEG